MSDKKKLKDARKKLAELKKKQNAAVPKNDVPDQKELEPEPDTEAQPKNSDADEQKAKQPDEELANEAIETPVKDESKPAGIPDEIEPKGPETAQASAESDAPEEKVPKQESQRETDSSIHDGLADPEDASAADAPETASEPILHQGAAPAETRQAEDTGLEPEPASATSIPPSAGTKLDTVADVTDLDKPEPVEITNDQKEVPDPVNTLENAQDGITDPIANNSDAKAHEIAQLKEENDELKATIVRLTNRVNLLETENAALRSHESDRSISLSPGPTARGASKPFAHYTENNRIEDTRAVMQHWAGFQADMRTWRLAGVGPQVDL